MFDVYSGLSDEYKAYTIIQPAQLNFRPAANDAERRTAASLSKTVGKQSIILLAVGAGLIALGILAVVNKQLGGIMLAMIGIAPLVIGIVMMKKGKASNLVATGILVKKESQTEGAVSSRTRRTHRWLVIAVDGMENALCIVHADPDNFDEALVGDRILVINDNATTRGKKLM